MKQNGSLCSVIASNLANVSLATQTWFLTEDGERWCCYNAAAATLTSNSNSLDFVLSSLLLSVSAGVIIVMQTDVVTSYALKLSNENSKSILLFYIEIGDERRGCIQISLVVSFYVGSVLFSQQ